MALPQEQPQYVMQQLPTIRSTGCELSGVGRVEPPEKFSTRVYFTSSTPGRLSAPGPNFWPQLVFHNKSG